MKHFYVIIDGKLYDFPKRWKLELMLTRLALKVYWKVHRQGGVAEFGNGAVATGYEMEIETYRYEQKAETIA